MPPERLHLREGRGAALRPLAAWSLSALSSPAARACPVCKSETGERVRQAIVGPDLGWSLSATILPFLILFTIVARVYFGAPATPGIPEEPR